MESLTKQFERRVAVFLRRSRLTPSEFGALAVGDPKFLGDVRRGRSPRLATASPWVDAVNELQAQFTGPIARGLSLIAIVVGGLMFAFGEGGSKRTLAGTIFGLGMAMGAANFLAWLF